MIDKITDRLTELTESGQLSNGDLVQIIELCGRYLNLQTISAHSKQTGLSYNGVKKCREVLTLFGCKLVINNE